MGQFCGPSTRPTGSSELMVELSVKKELACHCGSGKAFGICCSPLIEGDTPSSAESLMRSRYTAYVLGISSYLTSTWHSTTRPAQLDLDASPPWVRLEIRAVEAGGPLDEVGTVEFVAHWHDGKRQGVLHETSRFSREAGEWRYLDGAVRTTASNKVGRNDACPCASGRKYKQCCGSGG
jgi:SEC-C motif-containing protein